jgi:hypothetical protein
VLHACTQGDVNRSDGGTAVRIALNELRTTNVNTN